MPTRHSVDVDGEEVVTVHHAPDDRGDSDRWMLFSHGLVSDKTGSYEERADCAAAEGYSAVRFDHRGCGESDRGFDEQGLGTRIEDLCAVIDYFGAERRVLFGSSFGGRVALHVAAEDGALAVAVRAPVTYNEVFDGRDLGGKFTDALEERPFDEVIAGLDAPVAVFHGRDDETVGFGYSADAVAAVETDSVLHAYADEGHLFTHGAEERMRDAFFAWLETTVSDG